jgi:hypothetical protein
MISAFKIESLVRYSFSAKFFIASPLLTSKIQGLLQRRTRTGIGAGYFGAKDGHDCYRHNGNKGKDEGIFNQCLAGINLKTP